MISSLRIPNLDNFLRPDCKSGNIDLGDARYYFKLMLDKPSPPLSGFKALLGALVRCGYSALAVSFYKKIRIYGVLGQRPDPVFLRILLNAYSRMRLTKDAESVVGLMYKYGYCPGLIAFNSMLKDLCLNGKMAEAFALVSKMLKLGCNPDVVTYNTVIDGLCKDGHTATALELLRCMGHVGENSKPKTVSSPSS